MGIVPVDLLKTKTRNKVYRSERKLRMYFLNTKRFKIFRGGTPRDILPANEYTR